MVYAVYIYLRASGLFSLSPRAMQGLTCCCCAQWRFKRLHDRAPELTTDRPVAINFADMSPGTLAVLICAYAAWPGHCPAAESDCRFFRCQLELNVPGDEPVGCIRMRAGAGMCGRIGLAFVAWFRRILLWFDVAFSWVDRGIVAIDEFYIFTAYFFVVMSIRFTGSVRIHVLKDVLCMAYKNWIGRCKWAYPSIWRVNSAIQTWQ